MNWKTIQERAAKNGTEWKTVEPGCQWRNGLAEAAVKLMKSTLETTLTSHTTLTYAELDTVFASVSNIVNQRPIAVRSFTEEDLHGICPNDLLLGRSRNTVPGVAYGMNDSITRRQEVLHEIEELWWNQWVVQALPHLVPYRRWKNEHRSLRVNDIVLVLYAKKLGKGDYVLGRVTQIHPDCHGIVRTVTVDAREKMLPYVSKALKEIKFSW